MLGGSFVVDHPEREVLYVHFLGFQQVAKVFLGFVRVGFGEAQYAGEVVPRLLSRSAGLDDQVELPVLELEPAYGDALLAEQTFQGKACGQVSDPQERVLRGEGPVGIRCPVRDDDILERDGVKGTHGDMPHLDVSVNLVREHRNRLARKSCLDSRRLDGDDKGQQQNQDCRQDPERYAKSLFH